MKDDKCYKCGKLLANEEKTKEHIPPKCLVTECNRSKLVIVPSCKNCNIEDSKDIEYFRNWITISASSTNEEARKIYQSKTKKSWYIRPSIKKGMRKMIRDAELWTPSGIYLGKKSYILGEEKRILPVLDSIAKGILWYHFRDRNFKLPYGVEPFIFEDFQWHDVYIRDYVNIFINATVAAEMIPGIFSYRFNQFRSDKIEMFNVFINFYNSKYFYIMYLMK